MNYTTTLTLQPVLTAPKLVIFSSGKTHFQTDTYTAELSSIYRLTSAEYYIRTEKLIFHTSFCQCLGIRTLTRLHYDQLN